MFWYGNVAVAIRIVRPRTKGYVGKGVEIIQIGCARHGANGEIETFFSSIHPKVDAHLTDNNIVIDPLINRDEILKEIKHFDEAFKEAVQWARANRRGTLKYVFFNHKPQEFLYGASPKVKEEMEERSLFLFDEFVIQYNISPDKVLNMDHAFKAYGVTPPFPLDSMTVVEEAINILRLSDITPQRSEFELFERRKPYIPRTELWREQHHFSADGLMLHKRIDLVNAQAVMAVKTVTLPSGETLIAQIAVVRRMEGNILPAQAFSEYVRLPAGMGNDNLTFQEGLSQEKWRAEAKPYREVMYDLLRWLQEPKSCDLYTYDASTLSEIKKMDRYTNRDYYLQLFESRQPYSITIESICKELFPKEEHTYLIRRMAKLLGIVDDKAIEMAFKTRAAPMEAYAFMSILRAARQRQVRMLAGISKQSIAKKSNRYGFYTGHIINPQFKALGHLHDIREFTQSRDAMVFSCPICHGDMEIPCWIFWPEDVNSILNAKCEKINGYGIATCREDGSFLASATHKRLPDGMFECFVQLIDYESVPKNDLCLYEEYQKTIRNLPPKKKIARFKLWKTREPGNERGTEKKKEGDESKCGAK